MNDDVIVRFGADASELETSLAKLSGEVGGLGNAVSQANEQAISTAGNASDATKKQAEGLALVVDLAKQQEAAQEKLDALKASQGEIDDQTKMTNAIKAVNAEIKAESQRLKDLGVAGDTANNALEKLKNTKQKIAEYNAAKEIAADYEKYLKPVGDVFGNTVKGMVLHQKNLGMAVKSSLQSMLGSYISMGTQAATHWIASKLGMISAEKLFGAAQKTEATKATTVQASSQTAQTAVVAANAAQRKTVEVGSQAAQTAAVEGGNVTRTASDSSAAATQATTQSEGVMKHAGSTFAAVYDDVAQIPYVGWILAPAAAATAFAAVAAYSAAGGWERVPYDGALTELHKDEMVLPASVAHTVRAASSAVGAYGLPSQSKEWANPAQPPVSTTASQAGGGQPVTLNYTPSISAIDTRGARDFLDQHGRYMVDVLSRQQRNFAQVKK